MCSPVISQIIEPDCWNLAAYRQIQFFDFVWFDLNLTGATNRLPQATARLPRSWKVSPELRISNIFHYLHSPIHIIWKLNLHTSFTFNSRHDETYLFDAVDLSYERDNDANKAQYVWNFDTKF